MKISSKVKKSISMASLIALAATGGGATGRITTFEEALDKLTGPHQPKTSKSPSSMCVSVTPYFLTSMLPGHHPEVFVGLRVDGIRGYADSGEAAGQCSMPDEKGNCERGFVLITSTAPLLCAVPISL